jgi:hypothetical protein
MENAFRKTFAAVLHSPMCSQAARLNKGEASFLLGARETKSAHKGVRPKSETQKTHYENK